MNNNICFEKIDNNYLHEIYELRLSKYFPPDELKPLDSILNMISRNCYEALIIKCNDKTIGLSFMTLVPNTDFVLLDYLAIYHEYRNKSFGSKTLSALKEYYKDKYIFIESEDPEYISDTTTALSRVGFYRRNNCIDTGVLSEIWTVHYINFCLSNKDIPSTLECKHALELIYDVMVTKQELKDKFVKIYLK